MAGDNQDLGARLHRFDVKRGPDGGHLRCYGLSEDCTRSCRVQNEGSL